MKNLDLNNPEHRKAIQEVLRQGAQGDFWDIICQRLQSSIEALQSQMDNEALAALPAEEYKITKEILRKQKIDRLDILTMPAALVRELDNPDFFVQNREEEIYATKEDFEK